MGSETNKPRLQMSDLARLAGVSKSTVSRALAGHKVVNEKTREKILALAAEHNYRLNTHARNFRLKESLTIALLMPSAEHNDWRLSDPFFLDFLGHIAEALDDKGHQLLLSRTHAQSGEAIEAFLNTRSTDGAILIGQGSQHANIEKLSRHFPAMAVWGAQMSAEQSYATVGSDNRLGGRRATEHLIQQGCRSIVLLGQSCQPELALRCEGYREALSDAGLTPYEIPVQYGDNAGFDEIKALLQSGVKVDGIFACSDMFAMAAIRALGEAGLKVPGDVAVVGYDDLSLAGYFNPPLTSVRQDRKQAAEYLVNNVLAAIAGAAQQVQVMDPELIVRQSSVRHSK